MSSSSNPAQKPHHILKAAQQLLSQSEAHLSSSLKRSQRTKSVHHKLKIIQNEVSSLFASASRMWHGVKFHSATLLQDIHNTIQSQEYYCKELSESLENLKQQRIHETLKPQIDGSLSTLANPTSSSTSSQFKPKESLYDFVNLRSIDGLRERALEHIEAIREIERIAKNYMHDSKTKFDIIKQKNETLQNMLTTSSKRKNETSNNAESSHQQQDPLTTIHTISQNESEMREMHKIVMNMTQECESIRKWQNDLSMRVEQHTEQVIQKKIQQSMQTLQSQMKQLEQLQGNIQEKYRQIEEQYEMVSKFYDIAAQTLDTVESFIPEMSDRLSRFDNLSNMFHERKNRSDVVQIYQEIHDLTVWYKFFPVAYSSLLLELDRRHKAMERQQRRIKEMQQELLQMYEQEDSNRKNFFDEFGQYLPASLFPGILEDTSRYQVVCDRVPTSVPNLGLSESELERIREHLKQEEEGSEEDGEEGAPIKDSSVASSGQQKSNSQTK